jgi:AAA+ superfamily predicted ATPase
MKNGDSSAPSAQRELASYIMARKAFVAVRSYDERRVETQVAAVADKLGMKVVRWSITSGFTSMDGEELEKVMEPDQALQAVAAMPGKVVAILRDFHPFVDDDNPAALMVIRLVREVGAQLRNSREAKVIVLLSPELELPTDLQREVAVMDWPLPPPEELEAAMKSIMESQPEAVRDSVGEEQRVEVVRAAAGLGLLEAQDCFAKSLILRKTLDPAIVSAEKKQIVMRSGAAQWIDPTRSIADVGGLDELKRWLQVRRLALSERAAAYGLPPPRGVLLTGLPGTGKSMSVEAIAIMLGLPILRASPDMISGGLVGETESKTQALFKLCKAVGRCVLHIDEVEKFFAGAGGSGEADSGVGKKQFGMFLTWMQEQVGTFVALTANDIEGLPPELLRKGRLDEIFFVDIPSFAEREAIWRIHIARRGRDPQNYDLRALASASNLWVGAEIEAAVVDGMFNAFSDEEREFTTDDLLGSVGRTVPLAKMASTKVEAIRNWAKGKARLASSVEQKVDEDSGRFANLLDGDAN